LPFLSPIDFFDRLYDILRYFTITKFESDLSKKFFTENYFMIIPMESWAEKNMGCLTLPARLGLVQVPLNFPRYSS
jgi:hypothetical protein